MSTPSASCSYYVVMCRKPFTNIDQTGYQDGAPTPSSLPLHWAGEGANLKNNCRQLCEACLQFDPERRPDMAEVQRSLIIWLPAVPSELHKLGPEILTLIMDGCSWEEALTQLELRTGQGAQELSRAASAVAVASRPRRGEEVSEALQQSAAVVEVDSTWPEPDDESGDEEAANVSAERNEASIEEQGLAPMAENMNRKLARL